MSTASNVYGVQCLRRPMSTASNVYGVQCLRRPMSTASNVYGVQCLRRPMSTASNVYGVQCLRRPMSTASNVYGVQCLRRRINRCCLQDAHAAVPHQGFSAQHQAAPPVSQAAELRVRTDRCYVSPLFSPRHSRISHKFFNYASICCLRKTNFSWRSPCVHSMAK